MMNMRNRSTGFTLIELMVVVAVLGLLVVIGYPSYQDQVRKARRAEGMGELLELADRMERHYADVGTYDRWDGAAWVDMTAADILPDAVTENGYYNLSIDAGTNNVSYTVRAAPAALGNQNRDKCGTFIINSLGQTSVDTTNNGANAASGYTTADCWK